jgi:tRNA(Ile)-lysidine synthase
MTTHDRFEQQIQAAWPLNNWRELTVLVAVSGGADSISLLRALVRLRPLGAKGRIVAAHLNHQLRGEASDADEQFVRELAEALGIEWVIDRKSLGDAQQPDGLETAAREARYNFLTRAAEQFGARYVALAHTRDDQVETILHRIVRGTGIAGLAGMPQTRRLSDSATLIRPLLAISRDDVRTYLKRTGQSWREDASNLDPRFTRNRLRHEVLPLLAEKFNTRTDEALLRLGQLAAEAQATVDEHVARLAESVVATGETGRVVVDCRLLAGPSDFLIRELLVRIWKEQGWPRQAMTLAHWEDLARMARVVSEGEQRVFPGEVIASYSDGVLALHRRAGE